MAGIIGAGCVVLACYGLGALPINGWALAVMLVAFFGLAIDVQTGVPRAWTAIGLVLYAGSSLFLFRDGLRPSWITLLAGIGGVALAFIVGMPSMVRARFATPTIGREWMIGELGEAVVAVDPDRSGARARRSVAGPDQSGDTAGQGRPAAGGLDRRVHPGGRAGGRAARRTTGSGVGPGGAAMIRVAEDGFVRPCGYRPGPARPPPALPGPLGGFIGPKPLPYRPPPAGSLVVNLSTGTYAALRCEGVPR